MRTNYGKVDNLGFSNQVNRLGGDSWGIIEMGQKRLQLGDALSEGLEDERNRESLGAVVVFSDGRNNEGAPVLEVAKEYRARGIPVNVVGVWKGVQLETCRLNFLRETKGYCEGGTSFKCFGGKQI